MLVPNTNLSRASVKVLRNTPFRRPGKSQLSARIHGSRATRTHAEDTEEKTVQYNKEFGYSRKDVVLIGVGLLALGYGLYYGLQAAGVEPGMAGNFTQLIIFVGLCIGWVGSYVFRVANKDMTYVKQLKDYEEAVMKKRLEEMTDEELERMVADAEKQRSGRQ